MPTVLITGASTGIGHASALRLAMAGWEVFAGVRDPGAGERLRADFAAAGGDPGGNPGGDPGGGRGGDHQRGHSGGDPRGNPGGEASNEPGGGLGRRGRIEPIALDVTSPAQIGVAAHVIAARDNGAARGEAPAKEPATDGPTGPGRLDALVNNAGIGVGGPLELVSPEDLRRQFEVNVFGQIAVTRALLPALRAARGRVVLLASVGGRISVPYNGPYAASKHALEALGDALRGELYSSRIAVSLIEPGSVKTPIWGKAKELAGTLAIPPELQREYGDVPRAFEKVLHDTERRGVSPERVAATIERALTARHPRARYLVGADARGMVAARALLPTRAFDRVLRRALGL